MEAGSIARILLAVLAVTFVVVGSHYAIREHRYAQQCHEEYDDRETVYVHCEDFNYAVGVYGGSALSIVGVGIFVRLGLSWLDDSTEAPSRR